MAASLGLGREQSWLLRERSVVEEADNRRMLEFMLGPIESGKRSNGKHTTLDLLGGSCALQPASNESSIELEPESPLPSGWEKCLDLKTGSIYYLNRRTGVTSFSDPRKASQGTRADLNWLPSPATSEISVDASVEVKSNSNQFAFNVNNSNNGCEKTAVLCAPKALQETECLDLSLNLHVGSSSSKSIRADVPLGGWPSSSTRSMDHNSPTKVVPIAVPCPPSSSPSSSSSSTSSPTACVSSKQEITKKEDRRPSDSQDFEIGQRRIIKKDNHLPSVNHSLLSSNDGCLLDGESLKMAEGGEGPVNSMVTVACANCLMFVMLSRSNPKCPRCGICPVLDVPEPSAKKVKLGFYF